MSKAQLKKFLATLDRDQLSEMLLSLYSARKEAKEYLEYFLHPDIEKALERYKKIIDNELMMRGGERPRRKARISVCTAALRDFEALEPGPDALVDLLLHYLHVGVKAGFLRSMTRFGGRRSWLRHKTTDDPKLVSTLLKPMVKAMVKAFDLVEYHGLAEKYRPALERFTDSAAKWGDPDAAEMFADRLARLTPDAASETRRCEEE